MMFVCSIQYYQISSTDVPLKFDIISVSLTGASEAFRIDSA